MKALFAGIVLSFAAFSANAGGYYPDCRRGVDHKHPSCYSPVPVYQNHHNHYNHQVRPVYPTYNHRHYQPYYYAPAPVYRNDWVAPLIGGIILGTVINEAADRVNERVCEWREFSRYDGTIVRERVCYDR